MSKIRINELARELEVKPSVIIDALPELGVTDKKTHSSSLDDDIALALRRRLAGGEPEPSTPAPSPPAAVPASAPRSEDPAVRTPPEAPRPPQAPRPEPAAAPVAHAAPEAPKESTEEAAPARP